MAIFDKKKQNISYVDLSKPYQTTVYDSLNEEQEISIPKDFSSPLSFSEWLREQDNIEPNSQYEFYLQYVFQWYKNSFTPNQAKALIKSNYVTLLKELNIIFKDQVKEKWLLELDFSNDLDLQDMIDFYAVKLREIAYFLSEKRENIKSAKIKYNLIGSEFGFVKLFSNYILNAFTQRPFSYNIPVNDLIQQLPSLSSVNSNFRLTIKELYDETEYFNKPPNTVTQSNVSSTNIANLLTAIGLQSTDANWVFTLGSFNSITPTQSSDSTTFEDLNNITNNLLINDLLIQLTKKYIGDKIYSSEGPGFTSTNIFPTITSVYNFAQGNNWFYWPSGEYVFEHNILNIKDIPLSETTLLIPISGENFNSTPATAGETYENSDRIFVIDGTGIQGAWAQSLSGTTIIETMSALIQGKSSLLFKYPFPGYGEASDTLPWTGKTKENITGIYRFLDTKTKKIIETAYFSDSGIEIIPVNPIKLNDSSLIESGALCGKTYSTSDHIVFRRATNPDKIHDSSPDSVYTDKFEYAWLYDLTNTNIGLNLGVTKIYWPIQTYENSLETAINIPTNFCAPVPLSGLNHKYFIGARAGSGLYNSDILYFIGSPDGTPTQAAFLSGQEIKTALQSINAHNTRFTAEISGTHQPGLFTKCFPGQYTTFLWADSSININNTTITYQPLPIDSNYVKTKHNSIFNTRIKPLQTIYNESVIEATTTYPDFGIGPGIGDWKSDQSRSVLFSPIGHPGSKYTDYDKMCDIIFVDHTYPNAFSLFTWKDPAGRDYTTSPDFAWFKLDSNNNFNGNQPDVGWGPGKWVNGDGTTQFILSAGYQYKYLRASLRRTAADIQLHAVPYMVIKQPYTISKTQWVQAIYNGVEFVETNGIPTDIVLTPGEFYAYDHYNTYSYCITATDTRGLQATTEYSKVSSTNNQAWVDYNILETNQIFTGLWPSYLFNENETSGPAVKQIAPALDTVTWQLCATGQYAYSEVTLTPTTPYVAELTSINGLPTEYQLTVMGATGISLQAQQTIQTVTLKLTAIPITPRYTLSGELIYQTIENLTLPVDVCVPLSGWNILNNTVDFTSPHAKPIWVQASDEADLSTKNKAFPIGEVFTSFEHEILLKRQPPIALYDLDTNTVMEYYRESNTPFTWVQDLTYENRIKSYKWKKLEIQNQPNILQNFNCEQFQVPTVIQTHEDSNIVLFSPDETTIRRQYINYYAIKPFTWNQPIELNKTITQTISENVLVTPEFEIFNILNKKYPTIASFPYIDGLLTEDQISIFTPENLGLPIYLGKSYTLPVSSNAYPEYDATWMKTPATLISKSGSILNSKPYEKFTPYQNRYDILNKNTAGINYLTDITDPWTGKQDEVWRETNNNTLDFRGAKSFETWSTTFVTPSNTQLYNWGTDIYGNNYGLLKNTNQIDLYHQAFVPGEIWVRTVDNELGKGSNLLKAAYEDFQPDTDFYNEIINNNILKFAAIADVLIFITSKGIGINKIRYNYQDKQIVTAKNNSIIYNFSRLPFLTSPNYTEILVGNILNIPDAHVLVPVTMPKSMTTNNAPRLLQYDFQSGVLKEVLASNLLNDSFISEINLFINQNDLDEVTAPVLAYNPDTEIYDISYFIRKSVNFQGDSLISIKFIYLEKRFNIIKVDKLTY